MIEQERDPDFEAPLAGVEGLPRTIEPPRDLWPGISRRLPTRRRRWGLWAGALAAAAAAAAFAVLLLPRHPSFDVTVMAGTPRVTSAAVTTDDSSRARLTLSIGSLVLEPRSDLRIVSMKSKEQRFALSRGAISVEVQAPPRVFVVETPGAVATDLGCAYVLQVDSLGNGALRVTAGQVELSLGGRLAIVPAGMVAAMRKGFGPGSPRRDDAPAGLVRALDTIDFGSPGRGTVDSVLVAARPVDALTLWHLVARVPAADRGRVYDRLAALAPPPAGVTRTGVLALDRGMLDLWWNYLPGTGYRKP